MADKPPNPSSGHEIEIVRHDFPRGNLRAAIFDFDGTLSLLRRNWQDVMIPMMVEVLADTGTSETGEQLSQVVEEFVMRLTGRQTIYQMLRLCEEVAQRGGRPKDPLQYKHQYHELLWRQVRQRIQAVQSGRTPYQEMLVPYAEPFLERLCGHGLTLYLASGTDLTYVKDEASILRLDRFFGSRIYGALDDYKKFSKAMIIERIIRETGVSGSQILGVGDGFVEIEEIKKVSGLALGVASDEETRRGVNQWKRKRLVQAGADIIIGDYCQYEPLLQILEIQ